jgi:hypothetical protein
MDQVSPKANISAYIRHDVNAPLSQPLLTYLRRCRPAEGGRLKSGKNCTDVYHEILLSDGKERTIPDESKALEKVLINLIDNGPGPENVKGKSVSFPSQHHVQHFTGRLTRLR